MSQRELEPQKELIANEDVIKEAILLAPTFDTKLGGKANANIWQAITNKRPRLDQSARTKLFKLIKADVERRVRESGEDKRDLADARAKIANETAMEHLAQAAEHEKTLDPKAHDRENFKDLA